MFVIGLDAVSVSDHRGSSSCHLPPPSSLFPRLLLPPFPPLLVAHLMCRYLSIFCGDRRTGPSSSRGGRRRFLARFPYTHTKTHKHTNQHDGLPPLKLSQLLCDALNRNLLAIFLLSNLLTGRILLLQVPWLTSVIRGCKPSPSHSPCLLVVRLLCRLELFFHHLLCGSPAAYEQPYNKVLVTAMNGAVIEREGISSERSIEELFSKNSDI